jgi:hypothetical protein
VISEYPAITSLVLGRLVNPIFVDLPALGAGVLVFALKVRLDALGAAEKIAGSRSEPEKQPRH